jgi:hypothetical protein
MIQGVRRGLVCKRSGKRFLNLSESHEEKRLYKSAFTTERRLALGGRPSGDASGSNGSIKAH